MRPRDDSGAVTAEAAVVLPLLCLVSVALAWIVSLGVAQVRAVDAAREVARSLARGDGTTHALGLGEQVAPDGARFEVDDSGGTVVVTATVPVEGPGGLLEFLPVSRISAQAVAAQEGP